MQLRCDFRDELYRWAPVDASDLVVTLGVPFVQSGGRDD